jgi:N-acetyl-anhydromuramyl-L-alanine amidase AmpD
MAWPLSWVRQLWERAPRGPAPVTGHVEPEPTPDHLEVDAEGWLVGVGVERVPSVRHSPLSTPHGPIAIVTHYTAVKPGVPLWNRIRKYKRGVDRAASWHLLIEESGAIYQSVSFLRGAWHCAKGRIDGHRVNACSVGIELAGFGTEFSDRQIQAFERVLRALVEEYRMARQHACYAHSAFDPERRSDPGPLWMAEIAPTVLTRVFG